MATLSAITSVNTNLLSKLYFEGNVAWIAFQSNMFSKHIHKVGEGGCQDVVGKKEGSCLVK